jgi:hypothetical protein
VSALEQQQQQRLGRLTGVDDDGIRSDGSVIKRHVPRLDAPLQLVVARILSACVKTMKWVQNVMREMQAAAEKLACRTGWMMSKPELCLSGSWRGIQSKF